MTLFTAEFIANLRRAWSFNTIILQ